MDMRWLIACMPFCTKGAHVETRSASNLLLAKGVTWCLHDHAVPTSKYIAFLFSNSCKHHLSEACAACCSLWVKINGQAVATFSNPKRDNARGFRQGVILSASPDYQHLWQCWILLYIRASNVSWVYGVVCFRMVRSPLCKIAWKEAVQDALLVL